jgi:hypothetical protein
VPAAHAGIHKVKGAAFRYSVPLWIGTWLLAQEVMAGYLCFEYVIPVFFRHLNNSGDLWRYA